MCVSLVNFRESVETGYAEVARVVAKILILEEC